MLLQMTLFCAFLFAHSFKQKNITVFSNTEVKN